MGIPEANLETSKRTLEEPASEERHARRQRVEHLEEGLQGHGVGELHRRGGVVQGSSVSAQLCKFSIADQGVDASIQQEGGTSPRKWTGPSFWRTLTDEDLPCCGCMVKVGGEPTLH